MLAHLCVHNIVLINQLDIDFRRGLTVLTGETGAGKSILLDALGLALGSRADFGLIGKNSERSEVTATFELEENHPVLALLTEAGLDSGSDVILRRSLRDGKSPALINDRPVSAGLLRQVGDMLVEIQGQFEGRGLLDVSTHRKLLDRYAGNKAQAQATAAAHHNWQNAKNELKTALQQHEKDQADAQWLRDAVAQLNELNPQENEEEALTNERQWLANINRIAEALNEIEQTIEGDNAAAKMIAEASKSANRAAELAGGSLAPLNDALERAQIELTEVSNIIASTKDSLEGDEGRLMMLDDRLHALRGQARKHNITIAELPELQENLMARLSNLDDQSSIIANLSKAEAEAESTYQTAAEKLSLNRKNAAKTLDKKVMQELPPLKLDQARFVTTIETMPPQKWNENGFDQLRFEVSTNPGRDVGPIDRIASGGELARFLLAIKVVLADSSAPMTLIFDEVDSGVSGAVADAVGMRLSRLGETMQSLVITHSPQVASCGQNHLKIAKQQIGAQMVSSTERLSPEKRLEEISRMLSGATITPEARAAAQRLLDAR